MTNTTVRASYILGDDRALITLAVSIPNGKSDLTEEELVIAGVAATRALSYPVTLFGADLNFNFGIATARELGSWVIGAGLGYSLRGEYSALAETDFKLNPGDEFNITFGISRDFEVSKGSAKLIADFIYTNYSGDDYP